MRTKSFRNGKTTCRSYLKPAGRGWEVGFLYGTKPIFVGNFVFKTEATQWYTTMNKRLRLFGKRYSVGKTYPKGWFTGFLKSYLYEGYYKHLNRVFNKHTRTFHKGVSTGERQYKRLNKRWTASDKKPALRAA